MRIQFNIKLTLIFLALLSLLIGLGIWQLYRAQEKLTILKMPHKRLKITGNYLSYTIFLDNQYYNHLIGYHILNPLILSNGTMVLVNRGFIAAGSQRLDLPQITIPQSKQVIIGQIYYPEMRGVILGEIIEKQQLHFIILERLDLKIISNILHRDLAHNNSIAPFILRLDKHAANGYIRDWVMVAMPPERHYAYALQWFAMASVLIIIYCILSVKKL